MRNVEVDRLTRLLNDTMRQRDEAADETERLRAEKERLREALERVSTSNNLPFIWEVSRAALGEASSD